MIESSFELLRALKGLDLLKGKSAWWWEDHGSFDVLLGVILVQNTQWSRVLVALESMRKAGILLPPNASEENLTRIADSDPLVLESHISGFQRQKSARLVSLSRAILADFGSFDSFVESVDFEWLMAQKGIGRESAYSVLNYACEREVMVVDLYTHRLLASLGVEIEEYEELRSFCERGVRENLESVYMLYPQDMSLAQIFARFHGKIVEFGKLKRGSVDITQLLKNVR